MACPQSEISLPETKPTAQLYYSLSRARVCAYICAYICVHVREYNLSNVYDWFVEKKRESQSKEGGCEGEIRESYFIFAHM